MSHEQKRQVTVEDLLRLKRAERPKAEFWSEFDRELRAKQLAALVQREPWWRALPARFAGLSRYHLPLGATAVLAVTFLTVRDFAPAPLPTEMAPRVTRTAGTSSSAQTAEPVAVANETVAGVQADAELEPWVAATEVERVATRVDDSAEFARVMPLLDASLGGSRADSTESPSARYIAANLAAVQATEGVVSHSLLSTRQGFEARHTPARAASVDPLQHMTPPAEARIARYRTALAVPAGLEVSSRSSEEAARRLSVEELHDRVRRFGAQADRVLMKF